MNITTTTEPLTTESTVVTYLSEDSSPAAVKYEIPLIITATVLLVILAAIVVFLYGKGYFTKKSKFLQLHLNARYLVYHYTEQKRYSVVVG